MAETTKTATAAENKVEKTTTKTEVKKPRITKEVDALLEVIEKNLAYGKENNCLDAFEEGGKFYKAFVKKIAEAVELSCSQLKEAMQKCLPAPERRPELQQKVRELQEIALGDGKCSLFDAYKTADVDGIKKAYKEIWKNYCDTYNEQVFPIKEL